MRYSITVSQKTLGYTDAKNCTIIKYNCNNVGKRSPVTAPSTKNDLDRITTELQQIKSILKEMSVDLLHTQKETLGVRHRHLKSIQTQTQGNENYPRSCKEIQNNGNSVSGVYVVKPKYAKVPIPVLCDMQTRGGGWLYIQKRFDGSQDFSRNWRDYKFGFGDLDGEFWLGLENMYLLTNSELSELLVEIVDRDNVSAYAHYNSFAVGPEPQGYKLRLSGYSGNAGDSFTYHSGSKFSTSDLDFTECTSRFYGGWWYNDCTRCHLNGKYRNLEIPAKVKYRGLHWDTFRGAEYSHSKSKMLIRPVR